ncbi:MAG TPA: secretin N-terminal domain-containing protein [Blastocatellia bacterium]|nr:secretin N-terminal domain-containing protein [Blastocatellia bacterium]
MKNRLLNIHRIIALTLAIALAAPVATFAKDGKKHFKEGQKYEANQQWDKAAEQYALAVAEKPSDIDYRLHLQRALVNAGVMLVQRGDRLAEQKDYNAAYNAYRQAYSFDPTNELALIKMRKMLEAQGLPTDNLPSAGDPAGPKIKPQDDTKTKTAKYITAPDGSMYVPPTMKVQMPSIPGKRFQKTDVVYRDTPLNTVIEQLAQQMKLNVIFDQQAQALVKSPAARVNVELRDVTYPRALEMLLKTNNLMYAQLDSRTIVIASDNPASRQRYEPFALRTFYVKNADLTEVRGAIQAAMPSAKQLTVVKQLNALVARDTPANLELIEQLIDSLDKQKAEVLIDINIYEVSRNDLLQIGNQFLSAEQGAKDPFGLTSLGGIGQQGVILGKGPRTLTGPFGFALGMPLSAISFFQDKGKAKLLASTQVHVLDGNDQSIRIGQRVPIQTAVIPTFNTVVDTRGRANNPVVPNDPNSGLNQLNSFNPFGNVSGFPSFQYENVGLNIDMKPAVFEDEVELKMKIESSSLDRSTGNFTPSFNQRTMSSMARVKDGQTTLVAGVTQTEESKRVKGIPIVGLIPILGRFFSTPDTVDRQSDVVITVTPHILRRADITEEDHLAKAAGDAQNSTTQLRIDQILFLADQEDAQQNPVAGGQPTTTTAEAKPVVNPPAETTSPQSQTPGVVVGPVPTVPVAQPAVPLAQPPQSKPNITRQQVDRPGAPLPPPKPEVLDDDDDDDDDEAATPSGNPVIVSVRSASTVAVRGQKLYVAIILNGDAPVSSAHISLGYDPNILDVAGVRDSGLLRVGGQNPELQFTAEGGQLNIQIDRPQGAPGVPARGQLLLIEFTVKAPGQSPLTLNEGQTFLRGPNGQPITVRLQSSQIEAR